MIKAHHIEPVEGREVVVGQGNFSLKTVDDIARALTAASPGIRAGVAMNDGGMRVTRTSGNDASLENEAAGICGEIGAGQAFVCLVEKAFPVNFLKALLRVEGVVAVFAASANPLDVLTFEAGAGKAVVGVVDGGSPESVETPAEKKERGKLLSKFGYPLG